MPVYNEQGEAIGAYQAINKIGDGGFDEDDVSRLTLATVYSGKTLENYILQNVSKVDQLTGLKNRRAFFGIYAKAYDDERHPCLMMCDIDFFKKVNDTYGHKTGDKVLIELAAKAERALRDKDIVARYGGEEFIIFLPEINGLHAQKVADRLRQSISTIVVYSDDNQEVRFTVSVGVSSSEISDNVDTLIKTADEALYRAKQNGRNRVELFTKEDLDSFLKHGAQMNKEEKNKVHPIYDKENAVEISLLDGSSTQDNI